MYVPAAGRPAERNAGRWFGSLALVAVVPLIWLWLTRVGPLPGDRIFAPSLRRGPVPEQVDSALDFFSAMGSPVVAVVLAAVGAIVVAGRVGWRLGLVVVASLGAVLLADLFQRIAGPSPLMEEVRPTTALPNFPSGHVVFAAATLGTLALVASRTGHRDVGYVFAGIVVLMGPARIAAKAHLFSDVVAGYALGGAWVLAVAAAAPRLGLPGPGTRGGLSGPSEAGSPRRSDRR